MTPRGEQGPLGHAEQWRACSCSVARDPNWESTDCARVTAMPGQAAVPGSNCRGAISMCHDLLSMEQLVPLGGATAG